MPLNTPFFVASSTLFLSSLLGGLVAAAPAAAVPFDRLEQQCNPKFSGTHDCLEPMPTYSYHLGLQSNYSGEICIGLGDWDGENNVVLEWDGLQTPLLLTGKAGVQQLLQPEQREGRSSAIVVYSDQPIMPGILARDCGRGRHTNHVTVVAWPQNVTDSNSIAQVPEEDEAQASNL